MEITSKPGSAQKENTVATECVSYEDMKPHWDLIHSLLGGTRAMREAGETWLPSEPEESPTAYAIRLARSFLHPAYRNTVQTITSKPFVRPVTIQGDMPEKLKELVDDVTDTGENLSQFARRLFDILVNYGIAHILVDYPHVPDPDTTTKADESAMGARPRFVAISPVDMISFLTEDNPAGGPPRLAQIRYKETRIERTGDYADKKVDSIRVYNSDTWEIWVKHVGSDGKEVYRQESSGEHTFGRVPLVTCYINRTGFMTAEPPLEDLAWLNLAHWQSMSDQRNILRYARIAILFGSGFSQEEIDKGIVIGPDRIVGSTNHEAKLSFVEHTGQSIKAGETDIEKLEERMEILGLQPFLRRTGGATATGRAIDEGKRQSDVQSWIRSLENVLIDAFGLAAEWVKAELPDGFSVDVFNDFGLALKATADVDALIRVRQAGELSRDTFLSEIKKRGLISETVDVKEEAEAIENEGPALAEIGVSGGEEEGAEE